MPKILVMTTSNIVLLFGGQELNNKRAHVVPGAEAFIQQRIGLGHLKSLGEVPDTVTDADLVAFIDKAKGDPAKGLAALRQTFAVGAQTDSPKAE